MSGSRAEREDAQPAVTLADVGRLAKVSAQTVSNVLHRPDKVQPRTRKRVEAAIHQLGYQPNRAARALRVSASQMIGFRIVPTAPQAVGSLHDRFLHALGEAARAAGRHVLLFTADDADSEVVTASQLLRTGAVDGVVLYDVVAEDPRPAALLAARVPFVAFGRTTTGTAGYSWVDVDDEAGVTEAVDHLVARGHRRIAYIGWPERFSVGVRRARAWHYAMQRHGLPTDLDRRVDDTMDAGADTLDSFLDDPEPPTAVVTASDTLAVGAHHTASARGLEVGRDIAIVGFDDTPTAYALNLSSVGQPLTEVSVAIMELLIDELSASPGRTHQGRLLAPRLVVRKSSDRSFRR
ncbi:LacI family DNA-binding transcriptional regulator [Lentzea nigeriaca]|uniref:LacI family DNA-binding transcriptional regulator n=1 Tax=Lentzea nigeriaca TaxID=1128665 RepID=UPI0019593DDA|nr:LacI family DNA-binding transcriptional regulator [Lentzea nigeriaca]MBM7856267.1 DNA-binding LacI/PurR family transcriptional regulator [Lentzea nigeriaca]